MMDLKITVTMVPKDLQHFQDGMLAPAQRRHLQSVFLTVQGRLRHHFSPTAPASNIGASERIILISFHLPKPAFGVSPCQSRHAVFVTAL